MSQHRYELCSSAVWVRHRGPARWLAMAEIAELIAADYLHIMRWQMRLAELRQRRGDPAILPALAATWDTLASLIDLHMTADDEVCGPAIYGTGLHDLNLAREAADAHEDIREIIRETGLYPPGSPLWWTLATATLAAWTRYLHREVHGPLADRRRQASPALRARLVRQWRAFMDAQIRDRYQDPPPEVPTCQLRQARPAATVPRLADPAFAPLACVCPACTRELDPFPGVGSPGPAGLEPIEVGLNLLRQPGSAGALTSAMRLTPLGGRAGSRSATSRKVAFTYLRRAASCSRPGGSSGRKTRASRPAPRGSDMANSGSASRPSTISMDPPPMSMISSRVRADIQDSEHQPALPAARRTMPTEYEAFAEHAGSCQKRGMAGRQRVGQGR